ncbi:MAG: hypothetical protein FWB71_06780 [Defluviitaleaceae bacterium]|nr:hypothetical protein [Defluviitaleaceae bacterium]
MRLIFAIILTTSLFSLTSCNRQSEENTFTRHLHGILAQSPGDMPGIDERLMRLREFAAGLNYGGVYLEDLRVVHVRASQWPGFELVFAQQEDWRNRGLIAEMLDFAGIEQDEFRATFAHRLTTVNLAGGFEFMLGNRAVYDFVRPYLRLREFAYLQNSGTTTRDEIVIIEIRDALLTHGANINPPPCHIPRPRYVVRFHNIEDMENQALINEMLDFAELSAEEVKLQHIPISLNFTHYDFVLVNPELAEFHIQRTRMTNLFREIRVLSVRRGAVMSVPITSFGSAGSCFGDGFRVGISPRYYDNQLLRRVILEYSGISADNIVFYEREPRLHLPPEQMPQYAALREFMDELNAPFWADRYAHDPVIIGIAINWHFNTHEFRNFRIGLYDIDLLTDEFRQKIFNATGVENLSFFDGH